MSPTPNFPTRLVSTTILRVEEVDLNNLTISGYDSRGKYYKRVPLDRSQQPINIPLSGEVVAIQELQISRQWWVDL